MKVWYAGVGAVGMGLSASMMILGLCSRIGLSTGLAAIAFLVALFTYQHAWSNDGYPAHAPSTEGRDDQGRADQHQDDRG